MQSVWRLYDNKGRTLLKNEKKKKLVMFRGRTTGCFFHSSFSWSLFSFRFSRFVIVQLHLLQLKNRRRLNPANDHLKSDVQNKFVLLLQELCALCCFIIGLKLNSIIPFVDWVNNDFLFHLLDLENWKWCLWLSKCLSEKYQEVLLLKSLFEFVDFFLTVRSASIKFPMNDENP